MLVSNAEELAQEFFADFWSAQTAYAPSDWTPENPARGQCVPTSLAIQKYLGGDILRCTITFRDNDLTESHYWNVIGEDEIDPTFMQYKGMKLGQEVFVGIVTKDVLLADPDTRKRYEIFLDTINAGGDPIGFFSRLKPSRTKG